MLRELRFLTSRGDAPQRHTDHRDDMTLADESALAHLLDTLRASAVSHSAKQSQFAEAWIRRNRCLERELRENPGAVWAGATKPIAGGAALPCKTKPIGPRRFGVNYCCWKELGRKRGVGVAREQSQFGGRTVVKITPSGVTPNSGGFLWRRRRGSGKMGLLPGQFPRVLGHF